MESILIQALRTMRRDGGAVQFSFSNGAERAFVDVENGECWIGDRPVVLNAALAHLAANEQHISDVA